MAIANVTPEAGSARRQRWPAAAEGAPLLVWIAGPDRRLRYLNRSAASFTGLAAGQRVEGWAGLVHPADREQYLVALSSAFESRRPLRAQYRLRRRDGHYRWLLEHCGPVRDGLDAGAYAGWCVDITEFHRSERHLRRQTAQLGEAARLLEAVSQATGDAIYARDLHGRLRFANEAARALLARDARDAAGARRQAARDRRAALAGRIEISEERLELDGTLRRFQSTRVPLRDQDGTIVGVLGIARLVAEPDVPARHERDRLLAIVSHELRSPLNVIQSWSYVLEQEAGAVSPVARRALRGIRTGVEQQVRMIDDLLDASRVVGGEARLVRKRFALQPALEPALAGAREVALERGIELATDLRLADARIDGDAGRVGEILRHLLENALKFTAPGGRVEVRAQRAGDTAVLRVADDGCGIDPAFLPRLFQPFRHEDASSARGHDGLGLGLALVRQLAELHGGRVRAHSAGRGRGASFEVRLPLAAESGAPLAGLRVLVVDDQAEARESLELLLRGAGAEVTACASADQALAALDEAGAPDALVCDLSMPGTDGYRTLELVRAWEARGGSAPERPLPALALSSEPLAMRVGAGAGAYDRHLAKPVDVEELTAAIRSLAQPA